VITGYSGRINYGRTGAVVETITKLRLTRDLALAQGSRSRAEFPKVQEVLTVASDPRCFLRPVMGRQSEARIAADECVSRVRMRWTQSRRPWMLALVDKSPSGDGDGPVAVPAVYRGTEGRPGPVSFTLDVGGERVRHPPSWRRRHRLRLAERA